MSPDPESVPESTPQAGAGQNREVEAKFSISDAQQAQRLRTANALASGFTLGDSSQVEDIDTYYDTADYLLLRHGHTLRIRCHRAQAESALIVGYKTVDLKTPRGLHARTEVEAPAPDLAPNPLLLHRSDLPDTVVAALEDLIAADTPLLPICQLAQQRTKRAVLRAQDPMQVFGELSVDDVLILRPPAAEGAQWEGVSRFTEAELELTGAKEQDAESQSSTRDELRAIAGELRAQPGITPNDQNKMQQALKAIADAQIPATLAEASRQHMADLCRRIWQQQYVELLLNEAGVRASADSEYVHAMRVATRRARAASRLYATWFDTHTRRLDRFARRLRTTGRALGHVRDMDVALENLAAADDAPDTNTSDTNASESNAPDSSSPLARRWHKQRDKAHRRLVKWLDSRAYAAFITQFGAFCSTTNAGVAPLHFTAGEAPPPIQVRHALPGMIWSRFEAVRAFETLFEAATQTQPVPVETLHALRIECKYLRYHLEFAAPLLGSEGSELITAIKALQEQLGKLNDAAVASSLIKRTKSADDAASVTSYLARQTDAIEHLRMQVPAAFAAFVAHENRLRLARALAEL